MTDTGPAGRAPLAATHTEGHRLATASAVTRHRRRTARHRRPRPTPGSLPQTMRFPSAATHQFHAEMGALWRAIRGARPSRALPAFFPAAAYDQLKAIGDPYADWSGRLVAEYRLDIEAANALLGAHAASARLLGVTVPSPYAHWVPPDVCDNGVGYYEVPNTRMAYLEDGQIRSFGIASMISWRGVWYVVHLGAVVRDGAGGVVDDPSTGPGVATPSAIC